MKKIGKLRVSKGENNTGGNLQEAGFHVLYTRRQFRYTAICFFWWNEPAACQ